MKCAKLFDTIDDLYVKYLSVWKDVCITESPTEYKDGVDAVGKYFVKMAEKHKWKVEIFNQPIAGNIVCITLNPDAKGKSVTLSAHIDTVHPVGSFGNPAVRCDDVNIYGPGVMDCKGGAVAAFMAMDALAKCDFTGRRVQLLLQTDEESNSSLSDKETINYICCRAKDSVAFLNCEPSRKGTLVLERKGILRYRFDIKGKGIHSSRCAEGASAIAEAAYKILRLEELKDEEGLTCNCGIISGGTADNTVPDNCSFTLDIRFSTSEELEMVRNFVKEIAEETFIKGCTCSFEETGYRPAMEKIERNINLLGRMNEIFKENGLPVLKARKSLGGSDAADVTEYGIPCVDSIGVEGDFIHNLREYAVLESLSEAAKRIAATVYCI